MPSPGSLSVTLVTFNSAPYIAPCLHSLFAQHFHTPFQVIVVDNASTDDTLRALAPFRSRIRLFTNTHNLGFAAAQNQAIRASTSDWVLALNPDVLLEPGFLTRLVEAAARHPRVGSACGKLLAIGPGFQPLPQPLLDSTGIIMTSALRHLDRGWHEPDDGRYDTRQYVFGATGAAALYRRAMIDDVSFHGEFFDPAFFSYREDADVAWRAQLLGWRCLYVPEARAFHVRRVTPSVRRHLPPSLNMHSVKNRFLMRIKNITRGVYRQHWLDITLRDVAVLGCCLLWEIRSLPALFHLARQWRQILAKRRAIMAKRRVDDFYLAQWFGDGKIGGATHPNVGRALQGARPRPVRTGEILGNVGP
jgi:GT2 family glycosyltransferase